MAAEKIKTDVETPQQVETDQKRPAHDATIGCAVRTAGFDPSESD